MLLLYSACHTTCFERFFKVNPNVESSDQTNDAYLLELIDYRTPSPGPEQESVFDRPVIFTQETKEPFKNFWEWKAACLQALAENRCPVTKQQFLNELKSYIAHFKNEKSAIMQAKSWVKPSHSVAQMSGIDFLLQSTFAPFVMKLEIDGDEKTAFIGDIHGDIESFNTFLEVLSNQGFTEPADPFIVKPKSFVVLLGDYSDRGKSGVEVLYAIARFLRVNTLHEQNTQRVFSLRGNHESQQLQSIFCVYPLSNYATSLYGEIQKKFSDLEALETIEKFYNCLPLALFLKSYSYSFLACHGGIDLGFCDSQTLLRSSEKIRYLLIDRLYRAEMVKKFPSIFSFVFKRLEAEDQIKDFDPTKTDYPLFHYGFLWTDYIFECDSSKETIVPYFQGRGAKFPEQVTKEWFTLNSSPDCILIGNIRGHQHGHDTMPRILNRDHKSDPSEAGLSKIWCSTPQPKDQLWQGIVCTLCACPKSTYGTTYDYTFGAYCILQTAKDLDEWKLMVHHFNPNNSVQNLP